MKKCRKWLFVAALAFCLGMTAKAETQAATVTGVKQSDASKSSVTVKCGAMLGAEYYYLEMSTDRITWFVQDVSSNPESLTAYDLNSGTTYWARVGLCSNWSTQEEDLQRIAGTASAPIDVVTAPEISNAKFVQSNATTNSITGTFTGAIGANYYQLYYNSALIGTSTSNVIKSSVKLAAGTGYWVSGYPCRRSSSGFIAKGSYEYENFKTLAPKVNTKSFGVTSALTAIDVYYLAVSNNYSVSGFQWQFKNGGKVKKTVTEGSNSIRVADFINGKFIQYRVRPYVTCGAKNVYGAWSGYKSIGFVKTVKGSFNRKSKTLTVKWSKVSGASSYTVYASTKEKSGFKKIKTVKASKRKVVIKKIGKSRLKKGKRYYVRVVPKVKSGKKQVPANTYGVYSFYVY